MPSKSKAQQRFMGMVHAYKKGELKGSEVSKDVKDAAKGMKKKDTKKYASTKHKGLPNKVKKEELKRLIAKYGAKRVRETVMAVRPKAVTVSGNRMPEDPDFEYDPEKVTDEGFGGELKGKDKDKFEKARIENAEQFLPEICTLDCGTLNFGDGSVITVNTPRDLRKAAKRLQEIKVKPEIEAFDLGNMWFGAQLYEEGLLSDPPMFQMCLGIPWGAPATTSAMQAMKDIMPKEAVWSGFAISKNEMPYVAQTVVMGGNPRVGLEDNLYISKGKLATNAQLVEKARRIVEDLGASIMTPKETREKLKLVKHN